MGIFAKFFKKINEIKQSFRNYSESYYNSDESDQLFSKNDIPERELEIKYLSDDINFSEDDKLYYYNEKPVTGFVYKFHQNGNVLSKDEFKNGIKEGKRVVYWNNGNKKIQYTRDINGIERDKKYWTLNGEEMNSKDGEERFKKDVEKIYQKLSSEFGGENQIKKYNNVFEKFNLPDIKNLLSVESPFGGDTIGEVLFPIHKEYYFEYTIFFNGVFQLEKSKENLNTDIISEFSDDYILDGHNDEYEDFDETNEVFSGKFYKNFLFKIKSENFPKYLNYKLKEFINENGNKGKFIDFFKFLDDEWEMNPYDSFGLILNSVGIDEKSVEFVYGDNIDNVVYDENGDIICWYQYSENFKEMFSIHINN